VTGPEEYTRAIEELDRKLDVALARIRERQTAGDLTPLEAASERIEVLGAHLAARRVLQQQFRGQS
jgi:hypothetical protein